MKKGLVLVATAAIGLFLGGCDAKAEQQNMHRVIVTGCAGDFEEDINVSSLDKFKGYNRNISCGFNKFVNIHISIIGERYISVSLYRKNAISKPNTNLGNVHGKFKGRETFFLINTDENNVTWARRK